MHYILLRKKSEPRIYWLFAQIEAIFQFQLSKMSYNARKGMNRKPGNLPSTRLLCLPAYIYCDGESDENRFFPTCYMGDVNDLHIDEYCTDLPHAGNDCLYIKYTPQGKGGWAGLYWIGPYMNHWGEYPGYNVQGAKKLIFWARGEKGGEIVQFRIGGLVTAGKPFHDSFGSLPQKGATRRLTSNWTQYDIDLTNVNTSSLLSGFCVIINKASNLSGCTFYIDDIAIVAD